jgi:hypothetical protein
MGVIIQFPVRPGVQNQSSVELSPNILASFQAEIHLVAGKDVTFSIKYPNGRVNRKLVAAMLKKASAALEMPRLK